MKNTLKRVMLYTMVCVMLISILSACGSNTNSADSSAVSTVGKETAAATDDSPAENVTLTIECSQAFKNPSNATFNQVNLDAFQAKYPNIKIETLLLPDAQTTTTLQTKLAAGEPSDIIIYNKVSAENELSAEKNMVDLSDQPWVTRMKQSDIVKSPDGKIYGYIAEIKTGGVGVVYNTEIFSQLNLEVPKTYNDFLKLCDTIKSNGITPIYGPFKDSWTFQIYPTTGWGTIVQKNKPQLFDDINSNKIKWADIPEFTDVLERGYNLIKAGYFQKTCLSDDYNGAPAALSSKKYAMMFMGEWFVNDMVKKAPDLKLDMFPIPIFDDPSMNLLDQSQYGGMLLVPNKAKHIDEAKKFIDFISQKEQLANNMKDPAMAFMPNFKDAETPKLSAINEKLYNTYIKTNQYSFESNTYVKVDLNDLWKYYQDMIGGNKAPADVMKSWDKRFAELMKAKGISGF